MTFFPDRSENFTFVFPEEPAPASFVQTYIGVFYYLLCSAIIYVVAIVGLSYVLIKAKGQENKGLGLLVILMVNFLCGFLNALLNLFRFKFITDPVICSWISYCGPIYCLQCLTCYYIFLQRAQSVIIDELNKYYTALLRIAKLIVVLMIPVCIFTFFQMQGILFFKEKLCVETVNNWYGIFFMIFNIHACLFFLCIFYYPMYVQRRNIKRMGSNCNHNDQKINRMIKVNLFVSLFAVMTTTADFTLQVATGLVTKDYRSNTSAPALSSVFYYAGQSDMMINSICCTVILYKLILRVFKKTDVYSNFQSKRTLRNTIRKNNNTNLSKPVLVLTRNAALSSECTESDRESINNTLKFTTSDHNIKSLEIDYTCTTNTSTSELGLSSTASTVLTEEGSLEEN
eukprot:Pgem_evm1s4816